MALSVVTRGYAVGTVNLVVTRGFGAGAPLPPVVQPTGGSSRYHSKRTPSREEVLEAVRKQRVEFGVIPDDVAKRVEALAERQVETRDREDGALERELLAETLHYEKIYDDYLTAYRGALLTLAIRQIYDEAEQQRQAEVLAAREAYRAEVVAARQLLVEMEIVRIARRKRLMAFILLNS